jgi:phage shock protein E
MVMMEEKILQLALQIKRHRQIPHKNKYYSQNKSIVILSIIVIQPPSIMKISSAMTLSLLISRSSAFVVRQQPANGLLLQHQHRRTFSPASAIHQSLFPNFFSGLAMGNGFAEEETVRKYLGEGQCVFIDCRRPDEIEASGSLSTALPTHKHLNVPCTPMDASEIEQNAEKMIADKSTPVLVYCGSGMRSGKAKQVLDDKGYKTVLNLGGFKDAQYLMDK